MINTVLFSLKRYEFQRSRNWYCEHLLLFSILEINLNDENLNFREHLNEIQSHPQDMRF